MEIAQFDAYGARFSFEPPIEVGEHQIDSLEKLATIAVIGSTASNKLIAVGLSSVRSAIEFADGDSLLLETVLTHLLKDQHTVTVS